MQHQTGLQVLNILYSFADHDGARASSPGSSRASELTLPDKRNTLVDNFQYLLHIAGIDAKELVVYEEEGSSNSVAPDQTIQLESEGVTTDAVAPVETVKLMNIICYTVHLQNGTDFTTSTLAISMNHCLQPTPLAQCSRLKKNKMKLVRRKEREKGGH